MKTISMLIVLSKIYKINFDLIYYEYHTTVCIFKDICNGHTKNELFYQKDIQRRLISSYCIKQNFIIIK